MDYHAEAQKEAEDFYYREKIPDTKDEVYNWMNSYMKRIIGLYEKAIAQLKEKL